METVATSPSLWAWLPVVVSGLGPFSLPEVLGLVSAWVAALVCKIGRESEPRGNEQRGRISLNSRHTLVEGGG